MRTSRWNAPALTVSTALLALLVLLPGVPAGAGIVNLNGYQFSTVGRPLLHICMQQLNDTLAPCSSGENPLDFAAPEHTNEYRNRRVMK